MIKPLMRNTDLRRNKEQLESRMKQWVFTIIHFISRSASTSTVEKPCISSTTPTGREESSSIMRTCLIYFEHNAD